MVDVFKGYLAAPDKEFSTFIKQKKNDYQEGQPDDCGGEQVQVPCKFWRT